MAGKGEYVSHVLDLLQGFGTVTARSMFGGHGIYRDRIIFAIVVRGTLYFKADDANRSRFIEKGLDCFTYIRKGKVCSMSYYLVPDEVFEDSEALCDWAREAYAAALRARKPLAVLTPAGR